MTTTMFLIQAGLWLVLAFILILLITIATATILLIPFVPTPPTVVQHMLQIANLKAEDTVYDLGCGDARILIEAKRQYPGIRAIGYELSLGAWLLAKLRVKLAGFAKKNIPGGPIEIYMRDLRVANLETADVIFLYLMPTVMPALAKKIEKEVKSGTKVISHDFEFPGKTPLAIERHTLSRWYFMRRLKKESTRVFFYQW